MEKDNLIKSHQFKQATEDPTFAPKEATIIHKTKQKSL